MVEWGRRERGKEGRREGGKEGRREGGKEKRREGRKIFLLLLVLIKLNFNKLISI